MLFLNIHEIYIYEKEIFFLFVDLFVNGSHK